MSRTQRRAKAKPSTTRWKVKYPAIVMEHNCFRDIDAFLAGLRAGELDSQQGKVIMRCADEKGSSWYQLCPALLGWADLWKRADAKYSLGLDTGPFVRVVNKLDAGSPLQPRDVEIAHQFVDTCRRHYRRLDKHELAELVTVQKTAFLVESLQLANTAETGAALK